MLCHTVESLYIIIILLLCIYRNIDSVLIKESCPFNADSFIHISTLLKSLMLS